MPAGQYLIEKGVDPAQLQLLREPRGNHEVMVRGTFGNIRLRNKLAGGKEGGYTVHLPDGEETTIYEASLKYAEEASPSWSSPARSTARAPRATGPPRARSSSA
jgi:aconitate hydratase